MNDHVNEAKNLNAKVEDRKTGQGFTRGPWSVHDGIQSKCKCLSIGGDSHPIATVERGTWGDRYPSIRQMKDTGSIEGKFEAYLEMIPYGEIPADEALANARLIAAAPALYEIVSAIGDRCTNMYAGQRCPLGFKDQKMWCLSCRAVAALALVNKPETDSANSALGTNGPAS